MALSRRLLCRSSLYEEDTYYRNPDRKSTHLNSSHLVISYAVFCLKKKYVAHPALDRRGARGLAQTARPDLDRAGFGELDGVDGKVEHNLLQPRLIADHCRGQHRIQ